MAQRMYKVSIDYFFKTDEEFAEIEKIVWGDQAKDYEGGFADLACGGHDTDDSPCRLDVGFSSAVYSEELTKAYASCDCTCCSH